MEQTGAKLHYLDEAYQTVQNDIALTKRAVEKTDANVQKAQNEKLQQVNTKVWCNLVYRYLFIRICI